MAHQSHHTQETETGGSFESRYSERQSDNRLINPERQSDNMATLSKTQSKQNNQHQKKKQKIQP